MLLAIKWLTIHTYVRLYKAGNNLPFLGISFFSRLLFQTLLSCKSCERPNSVLNSASISFLRTNIGLFTNITTTFCVCHLATSHSAPNSFFVPLLVRPSDEGFPDYRAPKSFKDCRQPLCSCLVGILSDTCSFVELYWIPTFYFTMEGMIIYSTCMGRRN
jgi:hypothetical protein